MVCTGYVTGRKNLSTKIPFEIFSVICGIWAGIAFTFVSRSIIKLDKSWSHSIQQNFLNQIGIQNIVLASVIFGVGGLFGSGIVFGIDLVGVCPSNGLLADLGGIIHGSMVGILFIGAQFGLFINVCIWFDRNIYSGTTTSYIVSLLIAILIIFFGYIFSQLFSTPFIFTVILARILSSIFLYQFPGFRFWPLMGKSLIIMGVFLLPLTAYGSSIRLVCPT